MLMMARFFTQLINIKGTHIMAENLKTIAADFAIKTLSEALDEAVKLYESSPGKKLDPLLIAILKEFIKRHGPLLVHAALGDLKMAQVRDVFVGLADTMGVATNSQWIDCGVALFELGVTGMEWTSNTIKVSRVSSLAATTGIGLPAATTATLATALFGVLMTTKDAVDAATKCNQAISSKSVNERRPPAVINRRGYNLGQISTGFFSTPSFGVDMVCR